MDASPRIENAVPPSAAKPSSTSLHLRASCARADAPTCLDSSENVLKSLEEANDAGDVSTTCDILHLLREQYSQKDRKNWPPDVVRRMWNHAVDALHDSALPEVGARACQLIEVLAQNCKSCLEGDWETVFHEEAPKQVIRTMEQFPSDLSVQSSCLRALLSMSGCMTCRSFYDKETQELMGNANAISALVRALGILQQLTAKMQFETNAHRLARLAIADAIQTLHYICLMNQENIKNLGDLKGLHIIRTSIEDNLNELTVQEHGCMLLAELARSAALSDQEVLECVGTVTNVARLQMQEKFIEVARASVWSLARIASNTLHPCKRHSRDASWSNTFSQVWPIMQGQALNMILGMMQSCQLKNDPLVKHCLDFIAVVGGADGLPLPTTKALENFNKAKELVYDLFVETDDIRIKAASLRTLVTLMSNPHGPWTGKEDSSIEVDTILRAMHTARMCQEASEKDIFCIQIFGSLLISHVVSSRVILKSNQISQYIQHVHDAICYIIRYIDEGGEEFFFDSSHSSEKAVEIHEISASVVAVSKFLSLFGKEGINSIDAEGLTVLHKLAQSGLKELLRAFVDVCGAGIDYLQRTTDGANALQLARACPDPSCASILEKATELAAEKAQDTLLKELTDEQEKVNKSGCLAKKTRRKKSVLTTSESDAAAGSGIKDMEENSAWSQREDMNRKKEQEEFEKQRAAEEYERALAERRKQLEDMEAVVSKKSPYDMARRCDEKRSAYRNKEAHRSAVVLSLPESSPPQKTSSRFFGKESESSALSASAELQTQPSLLGSSVSVGSGTNNGSPDPAAAPAGACDDLIVDATLSAFQTRDQGLSLGFPAGDEKTTGSWHSLFAADPTEVAHGGLDTKWNMMSSSSGQNNHTTVDGDRHSSVIQQQIWPQLSSQPCKQATHPQPGPPTYGSVLPDELASSFTRPSVPRGIAEEDVADDTQILSWLSSEITGLIGNGPPADKVAAEMQKARDFHNECIPPPPPQNAPSPYDNVEDAAGFLSMDPSMSPFYSGNPVGVTPYMHPTAGNFVHSHSGPWGNAAPNPVTVDPRLIPQSEMNSAEGRPSVHPSRFWHTEENDIPSKHLWLGNLNTRLPRSVLKSVFEEYGPIEDVVTFPGRMYAFVNFIQPEDAQRAAKELDNMTLPVLTGNRKLVIKFRPNRKALGRVGDLMPGVTNIEECNSSVIAPSISVPVFRSPDLSSSQQSGADNASLQQQQPYLESEPAPPERHLYAEREDTFDAADSSAVMGASCRHLWLGNVCVRPSKTVLFSLFSRYGPVESVRVFPGKTYAFVNFYGGEHAYRAKEALDGKVLTAITGTKPLVVRFQREGAGPSGWARMQDGFQNLPPLQSAESAPGAYTTNSMILPQDRSHMQSRTEFPNPSNEPYRASSLSPEEYPPLNLAGRTADATYVDPYQTDRSQKLPSPDSEVMWPEGMSKEMSAPGYVGSSGMVPPSDRHLGSIANSAAFEASSIGQLTRTLSAAAFGKVQRSSSYMQPSTFDRTAAWNPSLLNDGGLDDRGLQSSYSTTLNTSHSFGGYDIKGYSSSFFNPQMTSSHTSATLSQGHLWAHPSPPLHPQDPALSSQPLPRNVENVSHETSTQTSLPQELLIASRGMVTYQETSELETSQGQQSDSPGFVSSAVISSDKGRIW